MHSLDLGIFIVYIIGMLAVGVYFLRRNRSAEDYYVGGRSVSSTHVGLSVVATDVGGGFSISLGGLGFSMGLSGSWMLFTGLIGAWLSAVLLIPRLARIPAFRRLLTFPQIFEYLYNRKVALLAAFISAVGYVGFTSSQILAGAKLAGGGFAGLDQHSALLIMGAIVVVYTAMGGLKAVIYTDTVQWIILMAGLIFLGIPLAYNAVGGIEAIRGTLAPEFLSFTNLSWQQFANWMITIVPIWFVGMTLYQRIYACRTPRDAQKAWYIAGLFEWPVMAFMGVTLGLLARVAAEQGMFADFGYADPALLDAEKGLPLLLRQVFPAGLLGLMLSAYFSAILSTADSCLMAASGNVVSDIVNGLRRIFGRADYTSYLRLSQLVTVLLGTFAVLLAQTMTSVLDLMLASYAFMVSGLLVPVVGGLFWRRRSPGAAIAAMLVGGSTTLYLAGQPHSPFHLGLDANLYGILAALLVFVLITALFGRPREQSAATE